MQMWDIEEDANSYTRMNQLVGAVGRRLDVPIDEVALLVVGGTEQQEVSEMTMVSSGWEMFNRSEDLVTTEPFGTPYRVGYTFFRRPEVSWRIELMQYETRPGQYSPLHEAILTDTYTRYAPWHLGHLLPVVHLSYKMLTEQDYEMEVERLGTHNYLHGQSCRSTYGRFSYLRNDTTGPYVKPRVNLRDAGVVHSHGQHGQHHHSVEDYRTHQQPKEGEVLA